MRRRIRLILVWLAICCARLAGAAAAEDFAATLELSSATAKLALTNAALPNLRQPEVRPVFHAKATENLTLHWTLTAKAAKLFEDVLVHFYVARVDGPDQQPDLKKPENVVLEGALTMDFKGGNSASSDVKFQVDKPGNYVVRIEAQHADLPALDEPFASMRLEVR